MPSRKDAEAVAEKEKPTPASDDLAALQSRMKALEEERNRLKADVKDFQDRFLRARADYENYARRAGRETADAIRSFKAGVLLRLIDASEDLEKAIQHAKGLGVDAKGLQLVADQFRKILKDEGVRPIETKDIPFNYRYHTAVERTPTKERPEGTILEVFQKGYFIEDAILRPASVRVAVDAPKPGPQNPSGQAA